MFSKNHHGSRWGCVFAIGALLLFGVSPRGVHADVVLNIQSVEAAAGSTGNTLDVTLTNTGTGSVAIGGFSFGLQTTGTAITFTKATTATSPAGYIFGANSVFGPDITVSAGSTLLALDIIDAGSATINANTTVGLGRVFFDVQANALDGPLPLTFIAFPTTNLADGNGNDITNSLNTRFGSGTITIFGGAEAVPEPSSMVLAAAGCLFLGALRLGRVMGRRQV